MVNVFVISGAPGTGKTSVIDELRKQGFYTIKEAAREIGKDYNIQKLQEAIFEFQKKELEQAKQYNLAFSDRGFGDTLAYSRFYNVEIPESVLEYVKKARYSGIFLMDLLDKYEKDTFREETPEQQKIIHKLIAETYYDLGYKIIRVPLMSVGERVEFIKKKIL